MRSKPEGGSNLNWRSHLLWAAAACLIGYLLAGMSLPLVLLLLGTGIFVIGSLLDARAALVATLFVAPFKALLETEIPLLESLPLDIGQILILTTFIFWLGHTTVRNGKLFKSTPLYLPLLIFILSVLPSFWNTVAPLPGLEELAKWVELILLIALVLSLTQESSQWLVATLVLAGCLQALIGIMQFFSPSGPASFAILDNTHFRAYGTFGNPDPFAGFMSLCLCFTIGVLVRQLDRLYQQFRQRLFQTSAVLSVILSLSAVIILALGLLCSWSRGAWLGFGIAFVVMLAGFPRHFMMRLVSLVVLMVIVALALTTNLIPVSITARLTDFAGQLKSDDVRGVTIDANNYALVERLAHWQVALAMAADHPRFGVGFGGYAAAYPHYALMNWPLALGHAHNYYLNLLAETGIVGLGGYLIAVVSIFWLMYKTAVRADNHRALVIGILGSWVGLSVHNAFDMLYVNNSFLHIGVMLGLVAHYRELPVKAA